MFTELFSSESSILIIIENTLTIIGALSLLIGFFRFVWCFFVAKTEWIEDIEIKVYEYNPKESYEENVAFSNQAIYPIIYKDLNVESPAEPTVNYFLPQGTTFKNIVIKKLDEDTVSKEKLKYKKIKSIKSITPVQPLCMIVDRREAIPQYMIEWKTRYGGKAKYYFYSNMRDTRYDEMGIEYSFGVMAKIRRFIGLV